MKPQYRVAATIGGIVILCGIVAAGAFVAFGSQIAVYSVVAIVPVLAVVGFLWVRGSMSSGGRGAQSLSKQRARSLARDFESVWQEYRTIRAEAPGVLDTDSLPVDRVVSELEDDGIDVDRETGSASLGRLASISPPDLESLEATSRSLEELEERLDEQVTEGAREEIRSINATLARIDDLIAVDPPRTPEDVPDATDDDTAWRQPLETVKTHREYARESIDDAIDAVRETVERTDGVDPGVVEDELQAADAAAADGNFDDAVDRVQSAQAEVRSSGDDQFRTERRELLALVDAVESTELGSGVDSDRLERLDAIAQQIEELTDAMEATTLRERGDELRSVCVGIIDDLESDLEESVRTLENADLPPGYYSRPDAADENYVADLESVGTVASFRQSWLGAASDLTEALERVQPKANVARGYETVAERIDETLRRTGRVTAEDLPVSEYEEQFMGLYAREHDAVEFDPSVPSLSIPGGAESYSVSVTAEFETPGEKRTATVELSGPDFEESETIETYKAAEVTFESLPYGEYDLAVRPHTDDEAPVERSVTVDADRSISVVMEEVPLEERLCEGLDDPVGAFENMQSRLTDRFEEADHLSSEMSFPIDDEYVPCLLAMWGRDHDAEVTADGDVVYVYEPGDVTAELRKVVEHNLEPGETIGFDRLRSRFLSVELPDEVLEQIAIEAGFDGVTVTEDGLRKEDE